MEKRTTYVHRAVDIAARGVLAVAFLGLCRGSSAVAGGIADPAALPAAVDLRPRLDARGLGPRRQGGRPTCSAFVVTGALEWAFAERDGQTARLSPEYLNWASNCVVGQAADGSFFSDLWRGFEAHGICREDELPYRAAFEPELEPDAAVVASAAARRGQGLRIHWIKEWDPKRGLTPGELEGVRRALAAGWPVCGGFLWPKREEWDGDVLRICPREDVRDGHSVLLVGYRLDPAAPGGGLFLIRNTADAGRDGKLTFEYLFRYMNDAAWIESARALPD